MRRQWKSVILHEAPLAPDGHHTRLRALPYRQQAQSALAVAGAGGSNGVRRRAASVRSGGATSVRVRADDAHRGRAR